MICKPVFLTNCLNNDSTETHTQIQTVFCEINGSKYINEVNGTIDTDDAVQLHQDASKNVITKSGKIFVFSYHQHHIHN